MASQRQIDANRRNALRSTGPRTPEGKGVSSQNARKHGLTARDTVISIEDKVLFEELRADLIREHNPIGTQEFMLVSQIADAWWRIKRIRKMDTDMFERDLDTCDSATDGLTLSNCMDKNAGTFDRLRRYESHASSVYFRSLNQLRQLQSDRRKQEAAEAAAALERAKLAAAYRKAPASKQRARLSHALLQPKHTSPFMRQLGLYRQARDWYPRLMFIECQPEPQAA